MKTLFVMLVLVAIASTALLINRDFKLYQQESTCVTKHVATGIERNKIETNNGTCKVKL